ncbi:MAG TPA: hypothetical protein VFP12_09060 [Allosphingosinicella sp.]|nr:hypothetical protein [Allosphingosinicella sp.]
MIEQESAHSFMQSFDVAGFRQATILLDEHGTNVAPSDARSCARRFEQVDQRIADVKRLGIGRFNLRCDHGIEDPDDPARWATHQTVATHAREQGIQVIDIAIQSLST